MRPVLNQLLVVLWVFQAAAPMILVANGDKPMIGIPSVSPTLKTEP